MRVLTLFFVSVLLFMPIAASAQVDDCTLGDNEAADWGLIDSITSTAGECEEGGRNPAGDDHIIIPNGSTISTVDQILYTNDESSLEIQSGGALYIDVANDIGDSAVFHFYDGQDDVGEDEHDAVALWVRSGGMIDGDGGFLERYDSDGTLELVSVVSDTNNTIATVSQISPCAFSADDQDNAGGDIGGNQDCTTAQQERMFALTFDLERDNPEDGNAGDNYLLEWLTEIDGLTMPHVMFTSGMEKTNVYEVNYVDNDPTTTGIMSITVNTRQLLSDSSLGHGAFPLGDRDQAIFTIDSDTGALAAGETCIRDDDGGLLDEDNLYKGACLYCFDASGDNGDMIPHRIAKTVNNTEVDCSGTTQTGDAEDMIYLERETALRSPLPAGAKCVVAPICAAPGDEIAIMAPVVLSIDTSRDEGEGKILFEGEIHLDNAVIASSGLILCDGCIWDVHNLHIRSSGTGGGPILKFLDMQLADTSCMSIVGGPENTTSPANGILFDGVTQLSKLTDVVLRYQAGDAIYDANTAAGDMGPAKFERVSLERAGRELAGTIDGVVSDGSWPRVDIVDFMAIDPTLGNTGDVFRSASGEIVVNGFGLYGMTGGGIASKNSNVKLYNSFVRGAIGSRGTGVTHTWAPSVVRHCDWADNYFDSGNAVGVFDETNLELTDCIIADSSSQKARLVLVSEASGAALIYNNIFSNIDTTNASPEGVITITFDDPDVSTTSTIERNTFTWDDLETSILVKTIAAGNDPATGSFNFGGNLVYNHNNPTDDATLIDIDFGTETIANIITRSTQYNNCVSGGVTSGTGGSEEYIPVDDWNSYVLKPRLGDIPKFEDPLNGKYSLVFQSYLNELGCGAKAGAAQPGMGPGHDFLYEKIGMAKPQRYRPQNSE